MKPLILSLVPILISLLAGICAGAQDEVKPVPLIIVNFDGQDVNPGTNEVKATVGQIMQFSFLRKEPNKMNRNQTLRIEIKGDAVSKVSLAYYTVLQERKDTGIGTDTSMYHLAWILRAEKEGEATVKITPIGPGGEVRDSREWKVRVTAPKGSKKE